MRLIFVPWFVPCLRPGLYLSIMPGELAAFSRFASLASRAAICDLKSLAA